MEKKIFQLLEGLATKRGQFLVGTFVLLSVMTFSIFVIWDLAAQPFSDIRNHAISVAKKYTDIETVEDVSIYNGRETYYSLRGSTSQGESIAVLISEESNMVYIYSLDSGISQKEAQAIAQENGANRVDRTVLGYRDGQPIWEVKSGTAYYLIAFETGSFIKKEGL